MKIYDKEKNVSTYIIYQCGQTNKHSQMPAGDVASKKNYRLIAKQ